MIQKQPYLLHVFFNGDDKLSFSYLPDKKAYELNRYYNYREIITGKTATVICYFNDYEVRRSDCERAAASFMRGTYWLHEVDLDKMEEKTTKGINRLEHPR